MFGMEAVILMEISLPTMRVQNFEESSNSEWQRADLDLLEGIRLQAYLRMVSYRQKVARYYNSRVNPKTFRPSNLISRRAKIKISKPT